MMSAPLSGRSLSLNDVFVDVSGSNDYIDVRLRSLSDSLKIFLTLSLLHVYLLESGFYRRFKSFGSLFLRAGRKFCNVQLSFCHFFCDLLRSLAGLNYSVSDPVSGSCRQCASLLKLIYHYVRKRSVNIIDAVDTQKVLR